PITSGRVGPGHRKGDEEARAPTARPSRDHELDECRALGSLLRRNRTAIRYVAVVTMRMAPSVESGAVTCADDEDGITLFGSPFERHIARVSARGMSRRG